MSTNGNQAQPQPYPTRFKKGAKAGPGLPKGFEHTHTRMMKDALLIAAELEGDQDLYPDLGKQNVRIKLQAKYDEITAEAEKRHGLVGYLRWVARNYPAVFCSMLAKLLPMQIKSETHKQVVYTTVDEIQQDIRSRKLPLDRIAPLLIDITRDPDSQN